MTRAHAVHNASSASYWLECGHYYHHKLAAEAAGEDYNPDSDASIRGRRLHEICENAAKVLLSLDPWTLTQVESEVAREIEELGYGEDLSEEDAEQAVRALVSVLELVDTLDTQSERHLDIHLEVKVPLSHEPTSVGTIDVLVVGSNFIAVGDYKFGRTPVDVDDPQFRIYAANAIRRLELDSEVERVILFVVQPAIRSEPLIEETTLDEITAFRGFVEHTVKRQIAGAVYPPTSIETCGYCPFRSRCSGYAQLVLGSSRSIFNAQTDADIEWVVANRTLINDAVEILSGVVKENPDRFPNWSRKEVQNQAKWNPTIEEGEIAHQLRLKGVREPYTLKSPSRIEEEHPDLAGEVARFVLDRGTHVRLLRPKNAPDLRPSITTREIIKAFEHRETARSAAKQSKAQGKGNE